MIQLDELYVLARRVLLDALDALDAHRNAIVLVGAQAVYLRVGEADLAVAPFTTDGDIAIDPAVLAEIPPLEKALMDAGFCPKSRDTVGVWITKRVTSQRIDTEVAVDLLVPASVSPGTGRRAARLPGHDSRAARIVRGLDGAIVDADIMRLAALEAGDPRAFDVRVAGPAALLVSKVHKINERHGTDRQSDKDGARAGGWNHPSSSISRKPSCAISCGSGCRRLFAAVQVAVTSGSRQPGTVRARTLVRAHRRARQLERPDGRFNLDLAPCLLKL